MFDELLATTGVEETVRPGSRVGVCALHGGLEQGTAEIAETVARRAGASFYAVVQPDDLRWHVPSHRYDPAVSDELRRVPRRGRTSSSPCTGSAACATRTDRWTTALLGGTNRELAAELGATLTRELPQYRWIG